MANDLRGMSKKQLEKLQKDVEKALRNIGKKEMKEAKKAAEKAAAKFGFTLSDLAGGENTPKKTRKKRAPAKNVGVAKYANPDDASQTWTGKGRQPTWYKAALEAGASPESLEL